MLTKEKKTPKLQKQNFDRERMESALRSEVKTAPQGLTKEEKRAFILEWS